MERLLLVMGLSFVAIGVAVGGCAPKSKPMAPASAESSLVDTGPCAGRLHDISGALLLYYSVHHALPKSLAELKRMGEADLEFTCPTTRQEYVYDPKGVPGPDPMARVVVYDATAAHAGMRLGISLMEPGDGGAIVTKVVALPGARLSR